MQVTLKVKGQNPEYVQVANGTTYATLKNEVCRIFKIPECEQRLVAGGKMAKDGDLVIDKATINVIRTIKTQVDNVSQLEPQKPAKATDKGGRQGQAPPDLKMPDLSNMNLGNLASMMDPAMMQSISSMFQSPGMSNPDGQLDFGKALKQVTDTIMKDPEAMKKAMATASALLGESNPELKETLQNIRPDDVQQAMNDESFNPNDLLQGDFMKNMQKEMEGLMSQGGQEHAKSKEGVTTNCCEPEVSREGNKREEGLKAMYDLGFQDQKKNEELLVRYNDNVDEAIKELVLED